MISRILKSNQPAVMILVIIVGIGLWFYSFIDPVPMAIPTDQFKMPFYNFIDNMVPYNSLASVIISFILILAQALLLVQFNRKYILINYRTYLPAFFYILITSSFVQLQRLNPVIFGLIFVYIAIDFIFGIYRNEYALSRLYLAGFFISIASLFWAPFAILFIIIWISLTILRPFIGREWIVSLLGFITPYFFAFVYYYVFFAGKLESITSNFTESFDLLKRFYHIHYSYYLFYGLLLLIIIFASINIVRNFQKKKIKTRKYFEINWWLFITGIAMFVLLKNVKYEIIYVLSIPTSFLLTDYFYNIKKKWYLNTIVLLLIASIVYIQIIAH